MAVTLPSIFEVKPEDKLYFVNSEQYEYPSEIRVVPSPDGTIFKETNDAGYCYRNVYSLDAQVGNNGKLTVLMKNIGVRANQEDKERIKESMIVAEATILIDGKKELLRGYITTSNAVAKRLCDAFRKGEEYVQRTAKQCFRTLMCEVCGISPALDNEYLAQDIQEIGRAHQELKQHLRDALR